MASLLSAGRFVLLFLCCSVECMSITPVFTQTTGTGIVNIGGLSGVGGGVFCDVDNDGRLDLIVNYVGATRVYMQTGALTFVEDNTRAPMLIGSNPSQGSGNTHERSAICADFDRDGDNDLVVNTSIEVVVLRNDGNGFFTVSSNLRSSPGSVTNPVPTPVPNMNSEFLGFIDYDNDGLLDFVVDNHNRGAFMMRNIDNTQYTPVLSVPGIQTSGTSEGDYGTTIYANEDECLEFCLRKTTGFNLYLNDGDGTFTASSSPVIQSAQAPNGYKAGSDACDFMNNGFFSVVWAGGTDNAQTRTYLYHNTGAPPNDPAFIRLSLGNVEGTVTPIENVPFRSVICGDFNNDGAMDVFLGTGGNGIGDQLLIRDPIGGGANPTFTNIPIVGSSKGKGAAIPADFDRDGDLDVVVNVNDGSDPIVYVNDLPSNTNYVSIKIRLIQTGLVRNLIGRRMHIESPAGSQLSPHQILGQGRGQGTQSNPDTEFFGLTQAFPVPPNEPYYAVLHPECGAPSSGTVRFAICISDPFVPGSYQEAEIIINADNAGSFVPQTVCAVDDSATTTSPTPAVINVLANDYPSAKLDINSVTLISVPTCGTFAVTSPGVVTFTPPVGPAVCSIDYKVSDNSPSGGEGTATITVDVLLNPTVTATSTPTGTATPSPSSTATPSSSETSTPTASTTETSTPTPSTTETSTPSMTGTSSPTSTQTMTATPSSSQTGTPSTTSTPTPSPTRSTTSTQSPSETNTPSLTPTPTNTASTTSTATLSSTTTSTSSLSSTQTPTASATPTRTATNTASMTRTPSSSTSATGSGTPSTTMSSSSSATPTSTPSNTISGTSSSSETVTPSSSATGSLTSTPSSSQSSSDSASTSTSTTGTVSPTASKSSSPTATMTVSSTASMTATPSRTSSPTATESGTSSASISSSATRSLTPTGSATSSSSASTTRSVTGTRSSFSTPTATASLTPPAPTITATPSTTESLSASRTPTKTARNTSSSTATATSSETASATITPTPSSSSSGSATPSNTMSTSGTGSSSVTGSGTPTPTSSPSVTASPSSASTETPSVSSSLSSTATASASLSPSASSSMSATATQSATRSRTVTPPTCLRPSDCDDGNICTVDLCSAVGACEYASNIDGIPCDDGDFCTSRTTCLAGTCTNGTPVVCSDREPCTIDICSPSVGCQFFPTTDCDAYSPIAVAPVDEEIPPQPIPIVDVYDEPDSAVAPGGQSYALGQLEDIGAEEEEDENDDGRGESENEALANTGFNTSIALIGLALCSCAGCFAMVFGVLTARDMEKNEADTDRLEFIIDGQQDTMAAPVESAAFIAPESA